jgi:molecular chaperone DnaK (HSP70)
MLLKLTARSTRKCSVDTHMQSYKLQCIYAAHAGYTIQQHLEMTLSRAQFDRLTDAHVAAASAPCSAALAQAGVSPDKIKAVLLVGGCR